MTSWKASQLSFGTRFLYLSCMKRFSNAATSVPADCRTMAVTKKQQIELVRKNPEQPEHSKCLKVAFIGAPNVGKSTLANSIMGRKFSVVSSKVHTTRRRTLGVLTQDEHQIIFLDTPGMITNRTMKKHKMERSLLTDPHSTVSEADLIMVVADVSTIWGRNKLDQEVLKTLFLHKEKPAALVLNKIDLLRPKSKLLKTTRILTEGIVGGRKESLSILQEKERKTQKHSQTLDLDDFENNEYTTDNLSELDQFSERLHLETEQNNSVRDGRSEESWKDYQFRLYKATQYVNNKKGWPCFDRVFMVCATEKDGMRELRDYILSNTKPGPWLFDKSVMTNQDPLQLAKMCVWEKTMDHLPKEIPYQIEVNLAVWDIDDSGMLHTVFEIICTRKRQMYKSLGPGGATAKKIAIEAKQELMNIFHRELSLKLVIKSKGET